MRSLLLATTVLAACSFSRGGLHHDPDRSLISPNDGGGWVLDYRVDDQLPGRDLLSRRDTTGPGGCPVSGCSDWNKPICEATTLQCRGCRTHAECAAGLCATSGGCPAPSSIAYVNVACNPASSDGTKAKPYCKIGDAVGKSRKYILVAPGTYDEALIIEKDHALYAESTAAIQSTTLGKSCDLVIIRGGADVTLFGFTLLGTVRVLDKGTKADLVRNVIGPSNCLGVGAAAETEIHLLRNLVINNGKGGLDLTDCSFRIVNNILVLNGGAGESIGGASLKPKGSPAQFVNNTVADNVSKEPAGLRCEATTTVTNSILWNNAGPKGQISTECQATHSNVQVGGGQVPPGNGNLNVDPLFTMTGGASPGGPWHLQASSPCRNMGTSNNAPDSDFDGDTRDTQPDIGADEIK